MKRSLKISLSILPLLAIFAFASPKAAIEWSFTEHDFGSIEQNVPVTIDFEFKNPGMVPLIVLDVKSSCGCTVPAYSKEPIPSGGTGKITVTFDAKDSGYFSKTVTVTTNTEEPLNHLYIKGTVE